MQFFFLPLPCHPQGSRYATARNSRPKQSGGIAQTVALNMCTQAFRTSSDCSGTCSRGTQHTSPRAWLLYMHCYGVSPCSHRPHPCRDAYANKLLITVITLPKPQRRSKTYYPCPTAFCPQNPKLMLFFLQTLRPHLGILAKSGKLRAHLVQTSA